MSRKESEFYVIIFINLRIISFKKRILAPRVMRTHIQKSNKEVKWEGRACVQGL